MSENKKLLYIGLNGYAGAGKDTVAKILKTILSQNWNSLEECKAYYNSIYVNPTISATFSNIDNNCSQVLCIAYADQLKLICSVIFGIPFARFYQNKSNAWINISDKFQFTEIKPDDIQIITAEDYYYKNYDEHQKNYYMSLREILVYTGTYVLQNNINRNIFVNIVRNKIKEECRKNDQLKYVIVTDNRFNHEINYMKEVNAITMTIIRDSISQLDNIAEHDLDDEDSYDYVIDNSGTYDELFEQIWDIVHEDIIFKNIIIDLNSSDNTNNYLRLIESTYEYEKYQICTTNGINNIYVNDDKLMMINPIGGPTISVNEKIEYTDIVPDEITFEDDKYYIITYNK